MLSGQFGCATSDRSLHEPWCVLLATRMDTPAIPASQETNYADQATIDSMAQIFLVRDSSPKQRRTMGKLWIDWKISSFVALSRDWRL